MLRGINKEALFLDDLDRKKFLDRLGHVIEATPCTVYAFALMNNHVHLLLRSGTRGVSTVMRKLLTWYAGYFNRRHGRTGHLFQNRYKSILCEEEPYFLELVRYIHLNPLRAGIVTDLEGLDGYAWTGHHSIVGKKPFPWIDRDFTLRFFGKRKRNAIDAYRTFISSGFSMGRQPHLVGGSHDGHHAPPENGDERILGSSDFVMTVLTETEENQRRRVKTARPAETMIQLIDAECGKRGINPGEVQGGGRRRKVSEARAAIAYRAVTEFGITAAEIARHLGVTAASITRAVQKVERKAG
jgi:REP element-mobilizing transposase RayT